MNHVVNNKKNSEERKRHREAEKRTRDHGFGRLLEAAVLVLLPVPAGDRAVHAGAVGAHRLQFSAHLRGSDGRLHRIRLHASAHHGHPALLRGRPMTRFRFVTSDSAHALPLACVPLVRLSVRQRS